MTVASRTETTAIRDDPEPVAFAVALYLAVGGAHFVGTLLVLSTRPEADWQSIPTVEVALGLAVLVGGLVGLAGVDRGPGRVAVGAVVGCLLYLSLIWFGLLGVSRRSVAPIEPPWHEFWLALVAGPLAAAAAGAARRFLGVARTSEFESTQ